MFAESMLLDRDTFGPWSQLGRIRSCQRETRLVVLEDGRADRRMRILFQMKEDHDLVENDVEWKDERFPSKPVHWPLWYCLGISRSLPFTSSSGVGLGKFREEIKLYLLTLVGLAQSIDEVDVCLSTHSRA